MIVNIFNAVIGQLTQFLTSMSYIAYEIVLASVGFLDFDPFDELIDQYNPNSLIGSQFSDAWAFASHWLPIKETVSLFAVFIGVMGFCILFRACLNWIRTASAGGGSQ